MQIHLNEHDGVVHVHDCSEHPEGGLAGRVITYVAHEGRTREKVRQVRACFFLEEHDNAFKRKHAPAAIAAVAAVRVSSEDPAVEARCAEAFKRLEALT